MDMFIVGAIIGGLLAFASFGLVIALCVLTLVQALTRPDGIGRVPGCGTCGYEVTPGSTMICPECGKSLAASGIVTPTLVRRLRTSLASAIIAWTLLMAVLATISQYVGIGIGAATSARAAMAGGVQAPSQTGTLDPRGVPYAFDALYSLTPSVGQGGPAPARTEAIDADEYEIALRLLIEDGPQWATSPQAGIVDLFVFPAGEASTMTDPTAFDDPDAAGALSRARVDLATGDTTVYDADGTEISTQPGLLGTTSARSLFVAAGADPRAAWLERDGLWLAQMVSSARTTPTSFEYAGFGTANGYVVARQDGGQWTAAPAFAAVTGFGGTALVVSGAAALVCLVIYAVGLVAIIKRRRSMFAAI